MTVRLRSTLASLPAYVPGRSVPGAVKLASNEVAFPPLPSVLARIAAAAATVNRYPDSFSTELTAAIAARHSVPVEQVVVGCGSVSLCQQLVLSTAGPGDEVLYAWRSFEAYPIVTTIGGATPVQVPLASQVHDLDAMAAAITPRTRLIFVCNPNNPTGTTVGTVALTRFLDAVPPDVLVVIDEAYREFVRDSDVPDGLTFLDRPNVIVLRTFSKAYGLAGLRVGYGIAGDPAVSNALRQTQSPFAVTHVAQQAALASLEPAASEELMRRVEEVVRERSRVYEALTSYGYAVPPTQANFVWLPLGEAAAGWAAECERSRVIVRPFAGFGVRVTIGGVEENDQLLAASKSLAAEYAHRTAIG
ncbi:histidinol-phosphate aminotransferase [Frankineae bacterium MT45]|nr:histidinol-phosphate aminotransferase [Frankineae bacterium MT45]